MSRDSDVIPTQTSQTMSSSGQALSIAVLKSRTQLPANDNFICCCELTKLSMPEWLDVTEMIHKLSLEILRDSRKGNLDRVLFVPQIMDRKLFKMHSMLRCPVRLSSPRRQVPSLSTKRVA